MKSVAADAFVVELARQCVHSRNLGKAGVKRRIETSDLRFIGKLVREESNVLDRLRRVVGIKRRDFFEFGQDFGRDSLRFGVARAAVHEAVPDSGKPGCVSVCREPFENCVEVGIGGAVFNGGIEQHLLLRVRNLDASFARAGPIDFDRHDERRRIARLIQPGLEGPRASVDRQDGLLFQGHSWSQEDGRIDDYSSILPRKDENSTLSRGVCARSGREKSGDGNSIILFGGSGRGARI